MIEHINFQNVGLVEDFGEDLKLRIRNLLQSNRVMCQ